MNRKEFFRRAAAAIGSLSLAPAVSAAESLSSVSTDGYSRKERENLEKLTEERHRARWRFRRVICNNDGNDTICGEHEPVSREMFLARRTLGLTGTCVDSIFYCTGITFGGSHKSANNRLVQKRMGMDRMVGELDKQGTDPLQAVLDYGHQHGVEVFWSHRMNDNHDCAVPELVTEFKKNHPEWLLGNKVDLPEGKSNCYDYSIPQVRDKAVECCREVLDNYDVDGIELDFFRHPFFFPSVAARGRATDEELEMMNDLVRRVRNEMDRAALRRGRPVLLAVRVPDSLGFAKGIGLDYDKWIDEDLVDLLIGADYVKFEPWKNFAEYGRKRHIPVYASMEKRRLMLMEPGNPAPDMRKLWMDEAYAAWISGMNGIYTFNLFDPEDDLFRLLGSPRALAANGAVPRESYGTGTVYNDPACWLKGGRNYLRIPESPEYDIPASHTNWKWPQTGTDKR